MRVGHLGGDDELEVIRIVLPAVRQLNNQRTLVLHDLLLHDRAKRWIKGLVNVLENNRVAHLAAVLNNLKELGIGKLSDLKVVLFLHVLDPLVALRLRVDEQRPSAGSVTNDTVFNRKCISRQALNVPLSDKYWISEYSFDSEVVRVRDLLVESELHPLFD
jgi:hypothetical protein